MPQLFNHGHGWETLEQIQTREDKTLEQEAPIDQIQPVDSLNDVNDDKIPLEVEKSPESVIKPKIKKAKAIK